MTGADQTPVKIVTLGPTGTCDERAVIEYMGFQGVEDLELELIGDFFDDLERIRGKDNAFLVQCSAHPKVHGITERYWSEIFVVDTFLYPRRPWRSWLAPMLRSHIPWGLSLRPQGMSTSPTGVR